MPATKASSKRQRFVRAKDAEHKLTPVKLHALQTIAQSGFLATDQVRDIHGWSPKTANGHLRDLFDMGLLDRMPVPGSLTGSSSVLEANLHYPTPAGLKELAKWGLAPERETPVVLKHLAHALAIRDTVVWLSRSARTHPGHALEVWNCGTAIALGSIYMDALFSYRFANPGVVIGFLETDTGSERGISGGQGDRWAAKLSAYSAAYEDPNRVAIRALTGSRNARLVITVPTKERGLWIAERLVDTPIAEFAWIVQLPTLAKSDLYSAIWLRPTGEVTSFLPKESL
jgi:hypothetical protein